MVSLLSLLYFPNDFPCSFWIAFDCIVIAFLGYMFHPFGDGTPCLIVSLTAAWSEGAIPFTILLASLTHFRFELDIKNWSICAGTWLGRLLVCVLYVLCLNIVVGIHNEFSFARLRTIVPVSFLSGFPNFPIVLSLWCLFIPTLPLTSPLIMMVVVFGTLERILEIVS
jgi:hypothetical protein